MEYIPNLFYICSSWSSFFVKIFSCLLPYWSLDSWCFLPIWICAIYKVILIVVDAVSGVRMERKILEGWKNMSTWHVGLLGILFCFSSSLHSFIHLWVPGISVIGWQNQCLVLWRTLAFGHWEATSHPASSQLGCQGMVAFLYQKPQMLLGSLFCSSTCFLNFGNHSSSYYLGLGVAVSPSIARLVLFTILYWLLLALTISWRVSSSTFLNYPLWLCHLFSARPLATIVSKLFQEKYLQVEFWNQVAHVLRNTCWEEMGHWHMAYSGFKLFLMEARHEVQVENKVLVHQVAVVLSCCSHNSSFKDCGISCLLMMGLGNSFQLKSEKPLPRILTSKYWKLERI